MRQILTLALTVFVLSGCVANHNVPLPYSIAEALSIPEYKQKLQGFRFYFGNQPHPAVAMSHGVLTTAQRANATGDRSREAVCARAFASALLRLRSEALARGGDAVIDIKSNWKNNEVSSKAHYRCATGALMAGVALKGTVVKLRN